MLIISRKREELLGKKEKFAGSEKLRIKGKTSNTTMEKYHGAIQGTRRDNKRDRHQKQREREREKRIRIDTSS